MSKETSEEEKSACWDAFNEYMKGTKLPETEQWDKAFTFMAGWIKATNYINTKRGENAK